MMRVVITGGAGFIGEAIGNHLRAMGHSVKSVDVRAASTHQRGDITSPEDCAAFCRGAHVVFHCAAIHNAVDTHADPTGMVALNVDGTANMLTAAVAEGVKRFIYLSSGKIYGDAPEVASREIDLPRPRDPYSLSKLAGEHYLEIFQQKYGLECVSIRPFSVYGPGQDLHTGYVGMLIRALMSGQAADLPGQRDYIRDFVHIHDVVRLCSLATTELLPPFTVLNAGSGEATSLASLVSQFSSSSGRSLQVGYRKPSPGTLVRSWADMSWARDHLGYQPGNSLSDGIAETIEWATTSGEARRAMGS